MSSDTLLSPLTSSSPPVSTGPSSRSSPMRPRHQAIQRSLQAHMPNTLVEWAGAESRQGSWTGLEARVFNAY